MIVATRVSDDASRRGAGTAECRDCRHRVWVTGHSLDLIGLGAGVVCTHCAGRMIQSRSRPPLLMVTRHGAEELERRKARFAEDHDVPVERVAASLPVELEAAIDALKRSN